MPAVDERTPHDVAVEARPHQQVDECLARGADAGPVEGLPQLVARARTVALERLDDEPGTAVGGIRAHAFLREPVSVRRACRRRGEPVEPSMVLGPDQMERAPHEPGEHECAIVGARAFDVAPVEPGAPGPDGEQRATEVLRLDREESLGDGGGIGGATTDSS